MVNLTRTWIESNLEQTREKVFAPDMHYLRSAIHLTCRQEV